MADAPTDLFASAPSASTNEVDKRIGKRIRELRLQAGLSRLDLAQKLCTTVQQVQRYEAGLERIRASRLIGIAQALNAPLALLFDFLPETSGPPADFLGMQEILATPEGQRLLAAFNAMPFDLRGRAADLVEALATRGAD